MHIGHRVSEDLDFAYTQPLQHLPKMQIKELTRDLSLKGVDLALNQNLLDVEEFEESGLGVLETHLGKQAFSIQRG